MGNINIDINPQGLDQSMGDYSTLGIKAVNALRIRSTNVRPRIKPVDLFTYDEDGFANGRVPWEEAKRLATQWNCTLAEVIETLSNEKT